MFGITPQGFLIKKFENIKSEIENALKLALGNDLNLLPQSVLGQLVAIFAERETLLWELAQAVYYSQYPDTAEGTSLDNVCSITGTVRKQATKSYGQAIALGQNGTIIPIDSIVSVPNSLTSKFKVKSTYVINSQLSRVQKIEFSDVPDSGTFKLTYGSYSTVSLDYQATAGTVKTALEALPIGTTLKVEGDFSNGFLVFFRKKGSYLDLGVSNNTLTKNSNPVIISIAKQYGVEINIEALDYGEILGNADTIVSIDTPVFGWDRVINLEDVYVGRERETDAELRVRRLEEITIAGKATANAIIAALKAIQGVQAVTVFVNNSDITDLNGLPPHSIEATVYGGDNDDIAKTLFDTVAAGIKTHGSISLQVFDAQGFQHTVKFSRPTEIDIYVKVDLTIDNNLFPVNGIDLVKDYILAYGKSLQVGDDVIVVPKLISSFATVAGILDADIYVGTAPNPTQSNNIAISTTQIAKFDSANIEVNIL
jgi:uncharacterized phage protein gp47/JayE